jgi:hypothetical protein
MAGALTRQDSPLVQIALIDALADSRSPEGLSAIRHVALQSSINPAVRTHAQHVIERLK